MSATSSPSPAIVWFRDDLRVADNPALHHAAASGRPLICVYVLDEQSDGLRPLGGAARWWLHGALEALDASLSSLGGRLAILQGSAAQEIETLVAQTGAGAVYWNRRYGAAERALDSGLKKNLEARGITVRSSNGQLLTEPWTVLNGAGQPFRVFTAYWRACSRQDEPAVPLSAPATLTFHPWPGQMRTVSLASLRLEPHTPDWAGGLRRAWRRGEAAAHERLDDFLEDGLAGYANHRDLPHVAGTSRLSPYLRFGHLSPRQIWHAAKAAMRAGTTRASQTDLDKLLAELGWREFSYHQLYYFPDLARRNFQARFDAMPWRTDPAALRAWQQGRTGYPLVDAGMRELWTTGWMHNRVRMVCASFLAKHLLLDWRDGEAWFWDTLVDADPASNPSSWQWVAGSGVDAAPYFRIFNPVLQAEKFDPQAVYVKRWVPELDGLPTSVVHHPWEASPAQREAAGLTLGQTYPAPIVAHQAARERALDALKLTTSPSA